MKKNSCLLIALKKERMIKQYFSFKITYNPWSINYTKGI